MIIHRRRYREHRQNARARSIPFNLTFREWRNLWEASGKWNERGNQRGQYCMARPGDKGAYEIGNVMICLIEDNRAERNRNYPMKGEMNPAFGKNYWVPGRQPTGAFAKDWPKSPQMRERLAKTVTGRKRLYRPDGSWTWSYPV